MAGKTANKTGVWLAGWRSVEFSFNDALAPLDCRETTHSCLEALTQLGYMVEISGTVGNYGVRCLRLRQGPYLAAPGVNMAYCGANLNAVLQAAAYEADLMACTVGDAITSTTERARWAQS